MIYEQDYDYITECLENAGLAMVAAESHGNACGVICSQIGISQDQWFDKLIATEDVSVDHIELLADLLKQLYLTSEQSLINIDFEFELFLLDDDTEIRDRLDALGDWCSGFLLGLSTGGITDIKTMPEEITAFLGDCLEIARVGNSDLNNSEDDETSYTELVEYVRMGVITMFEEIYLFNKEISDNSNPTKH